MLSRVYAAMPGHRNYAGSEHYHSRYTKAH